MTINFSGKRVLLTGDSHMEWSPFGRRLQAKLEQLGATVVNLSIGGSSARVWSSGRPVCRTSGERRCLTVEDIRAQGPYDVAIVSLGTNDAANADVDGGDLAARARTTAERLRQFADAIPANEVWIVGPPRMAGRGHYTDRTMAPVAEASAAEFGPRFIDSRSVPRVDGDGIHVGQRGGEAWSSLVIDSMRSGGSGVTRSGSAFGFGVTVLLVAGFVAYLSSRRRTQ